MKEIQQDVALEAKMRLVEVGGGVAQDLGLGRIVGQILVFLYLNEAECSLDEIGDDLGLSKAAVSIAARQLESLGLVRRVWKKGDRKNYYRTVDNIAVALRDGLLAFARQKTQVMASELDQVDSMLEDQVNSLGVTPEMEFLHRRVRRAKDLRDRISKLLNSPVFRIITKS